MCKNFMECIYIIELFIHIHTFTYIYIHIYMYTPDI